MNIDWLRKLQNKLSPTRFLLLACLTTQTLASKLITPMDYEPKDKWL